MMEYYDLIKTWSFTGEIGMYTYWLPLVLCAIGYSVRTIKQIQGIKAYRERSGKLTDHVPYVHDLTVGTVLWRVLLTVTPVINILALSFSLLTDMVGQVLSWVGSVLDFKLVSK